MNSQSRPWTTQDLTDLATSLGLHVSKLDAAQLKFHFPSDATGLLIFRGDSRHLEYIAELVVNNRDTRTEWLLERLQLRYETLGTDSSDTWVRIGLTDFDPQVLEIIREWVERHLQAPVSNTGGIRPSTVDQDKSHVHAPHILPAYPTPHQGPPRPRPP